MDACNQTAGCTVERFLHKTSPNQYSIETNTSHLQSGRIHIKLRSVCLLFQDWIQQKQHVPYSTPESREVFVHWPVSYLMHVQNRNPMQSLISLWFVVQLHQKGGQTPSQAPGILLCHNRWEVCQPQVLYWATWARTVGHHTFLKTVVSIQSFSWFTGHIQHFSSHRQKQQRFNLKRHSCVFRRYYHVASVRYCHCANQSVSPASTVLTALDFMKFISILKPSALQCRPLASF